MVLGMVKVGNMRVDTPAVVLGAGVNGLGMARSLAGAGVPVWLLDTDGHCPEMRTRAARGLKIRAMHGEALIEDLADLAATQFRDLHPVLFLTQEETVKTVSQYRERLAALYRFSLPSRDIVSALLHKHGFQRLAEQCGAPIPPLLQMRTLADLPALEHLRYPVVVKPGERNTEYGRQFKKAYRIASAAEAAELLHRILPVMPDVVVQEWIEGPDANIYFCLQYFDRQGRPVAAFTGRKIRSWPPQVGGTASCTAARDVHEQLSGMTARFFQAAGVTGMAGMEYKRDARSGEFRMVEPTIGRSDYQQEVATLNGVNLPYAAYCEELALPRPPTAQPKYPVAWRVRSEDERSAAAQRQRAGTGFGGAGRVVDAWWRWTDPLPFLVQSLRRVRRALHIRISNSLPGSQMAKSKS